MNTKSILLPVLMLALASCSSVQVPTQPSSQTPEVLQKEPGIEVLLLDPSSRTARPDFTGKMKLVSENISYPEHLKDMPALAEAPGSVKFNTELLKEHQIQQQAVTVVKTEWKPGEAFTKQFVSSPFQRRVGPQQITITVAGEYNLQISAEGNIQMVRVSGSGSIKVQAGMTYSKTYYTCATFEKITTERYIRYYQWATYSDGTVKKTGGYSDVKQPSQIGDVKDNRISSWSTC